MKIEMICTGHGLQQTPDGPRTMVSLTSALGQPLSSSLTMVVTMEDAGKMPVGSEFTVEIAPAAKA